jgi:uncharacterized protein (TIGR00251 family)
MSKNEFRVCVKVQPNAGSNQVLGINDGVWRIKISAPPDKGKANKKLVEFLSERLGIRKDCIIILKGETSHNKVLAIAGIGQKEFTAALTAICKNSI